MYTSYVFILEKRGFGIRVGVTIPYGILEMRNDSLSDQGVKFKHPRLYKLYKSSN